jgi:hypothetical protein
MAGDRRRCDTCAPKHTVEKKQCYATLKNGNRERKRERKMTLAINDNNIRQSTLR